MQEWQLVWIAQGLGVLGLFCLVTGFLMRTRIAIMAWGIAAAVFWSAHFGMLEAWTGLAMNAIAVARQTVFTLRGIRPWASKAWWPWLFCLLFALGGFLSWQNILSLLPTVAMFFGTIALWQLETWKLRLLSMLPPPLWFTYNFFHGSWPGMLTETCILLSQVAGFFLHERKKFRLHKSPRDGSLPTSKR